MKGACGAVRRVEQQTVLCSSTVPQVYFFRPGESATRQSTFLFADLGLEAGSVKPCIVEIQLCSASRNAGSSAVSFAAFARTSTTSCGVLRHNQAAPKADGEINASFNVGTSGMVFIRSSAITTSVFSLPPFTWLITSRAYGNRFNVPT